MSDPKDLDSFLGPDLKQIADPVLLGWIRIRPYDKCTHRSNCLKTVSFTIYFIMIILNIIIYL